MVLVKETSSLSSGESPASTIRLVGEGFCKCDADLKDWLNQWKWYPHRSFCRTYVVRKFKRNGKVKTLFMHRIVAKTPQGYLCHHINRDTLDNRRANLQNLTKFEHIKMHSYR